MKILVARDYEVNKETACRSPLLYAAQNGHEAVVKILVEPDDIEVNTKDGHGRDRKSVV